MLLFLFKSMVALSIMFGLYKLLLGRTTFFRANHATLLLSTVLAVVAPFVQIPVERETAAVGYVDDVILYTGYASVVGAEPAARMMTWQNALALIYIIGIVVCLAMILRSALRIVLFIRRTSATERTREYTLLVSENPQTAPYSFGRYVVMSRADYEQNRELILSHELCHVSHRHTVSVMFMNLLCAVLWLNPIVWLVREELLLVCEYEADTAVISTGIDAKQYQLLLIKKAVSPSRYTIANSLNHSSLKKRITMMRNKNSNPWARLGYAGIALSAALVLPAFAHKDLIRPIENTLKENLVEELKSEIADKVTEISSPTQAVVEEIALPASNDSLKVLAVAAVKKNNAAEAKNTAAVVSNEGQKFNAGENPYVLIDGKEGSVNDVSQNDIASVTVLKAEQAVAKYGEKAKNGAVLITTKAKDDDKEKGLAVAEKMPQYEGGSQAMMLFIASNIQYPEQAAKDKKEGRVIVQFVVTKEGAVTDASIVRGIDPELDAEALRVVSLTSGHWTPGEQFGEKINCKYTLPVSFKLK